MLCIIPSLQFPTDPTLGDQVAALQTRLEVRDAEVELLKPMIAKLTLQLARRNRVLYGASSEQFDVQGTLIEMPVPEPKSAPCAVATPEAANARSIAPHVRLVVASIEPKNAGAMMEDRIGKVRTSIQGSGGREAAAAGERCAG